MLREGFYFKSKTMETKNQTSLENRPGILIVGSSNVCKRTLISRLISVDFEDASESDSSSKVLVHGWTINTKYYTADVSLWMAHLHEGFSVGMLPGLDCLDALVMVFDLNDLSTLDALKDWASRIDLKQFEILLCVGNKVDLLPGHPVHAEYRRRLLNPAEPSDLSVNGDSQGVERLFGALSAHMWPGMILKSGDKITEPSLPEKEEFSEEESDYEFEYGVLSPGSAEPWDDSDEVWVSADGIVGIPDAWGSSAQNISVTDSQYPTKQT